ncbi:MAG: helix-turn-helix domain-containing protein [Candidatus Dojkabacteria bacterium]|jgi:cytoskeletal protein RodZ
MITVGQVVKNKRQQLRISLDVAASETKIQKRFLQFIEKDEFSPFESEVFLKGFIKIYAEYLGLDVKKVLALYRRTNHVPDTKDQDKGNKQDIFKTKRHRFTPQLFITAILVLFSLGIIAYISFQIYKFQTPPKLTIIEPQQDITVTEETIKLTGKVSENASVEINDVVVERNEYGDFEKDIKLNEGINIVTIKAKKNNNNVLETVETRKITYKKEEVKQEEIPQENIIKLKIKEAPAWVKLDIDSENKIAKIVEPSETEFKIEKTLHIITGRLSSTEIYFNNEIVEWHSKSSTGVAEMQCNVLDGKITCD